MRVEMLAPVEREGLLNILGEDYQDASDKELYNMVRESLSEMTPEQAEGFWDVVKDIGAKALPGAIQGAMSGSALGPWGALGGAVLGGASGALSGGGQAPPAQPTQIPAKAAAPQVPIAGTAKPPAAAQLLQLLNSPALQQALASLIMGSAGRQTLPVGGKQVPTADFTNTLGVLASLASKEAAEAYATTGQETYIPEGLDPINPDDRAEALMGLLQGQEELIKVSESTDLTTSDQGINFIKQFEGFSSNLYNDAVGHCTIGYGTLVHRGNCNGSESYGFQAGISKQRATELLKQEAGKVEEVINANVTTPLSQSQFDSLVSFAYNVGTGAFKKSTLLKKLNNGDYSAVPKELKRWVKGGGKTIQGLVRRRDAEANLFANGIYSASGTDKGVSESESYVAPLTFEGEFSELFSQGSPLILELR